MPIQAMCQLIWFCSLVPTQSYTYLSLMLVYNKNAESNDIYRLGYILFLLHLNKNKYSKKIVIYHRINMSKWTFFCSTSNPLWRVTFYTYPEDGSQGSAFKCIGILQVFFERLLSRLLFSFFFSYIFLFILFDTVYCGHKLVLLLAHWTSRSWSNTTLLVSSSNYYTESIMLLLYGQIMFS